MITESIHDALPILKQTLAALGPLRSRFRSGAFIGDANEDDELPDGELPQALPGLPLQVDGTDRQEESIALCTIDKLGRPFRRGRNTYRIFFPLTGRYGVYIIVDDSDNVLYVGEAHGQNLKERIAQNYTKGDTGGTFRKNWRGEGNEEEEPRPFGEFRQMLSGCRAVVVSGQTKDASWIRLLEQALIFVFDPPHNKD